MRFIKLVSADHLVKSILLVLVLTTLVTRCSPSATTISEEKLSVGFSRSIQLVARILPMSNVVKSPNRRQPGLYQYFLTSENSSMVLVSNLPYSSILKVQFRVQNLIGQAGNLTVLSGGKTLVSVDLLEARTKHFLVHVGPRNSKQLFFQLDSPGLADSQKVKITFEGIFQI
jgi:hypothetical protein